MLTPTRKTALFAFAMMLPVVMQAQRPMSRDRWTGINSVAPLIDMRRELNLTSRQLVQLDSIERVLLARNQGLRNQLRVRLDSTRPRGSITSEQEIAAMRAESDSLRALRNVIVRNDSVARVAAMAVLSDSQRIYVRERIAERRGFESGRRARMREGRMREGRPPEFSERMQPGPRGRMRMGGPGAPEFGEGMQPGMRGRMGGMGGPGMRLRETPARGPDYSGPRWFRRPPPPTEVR